MRTLPVLALMAGLAAPLPAQHSRLSVGVFVGATSDYDAAHSTVVNGSTPQRHLSVGVPVRIRLRGTQPWSLGLLTALEWSYADAATRMAGLAHGSLGPEVQRSLGGATDVRLAALAGILTRRGDWFDRADHPQFGLEAGTGLRFGAWRVGYSYRAGWVGRVRRPQISCGDGFTVCPAEVQHEPAQTLRFDRHALVVDRRF